MFFPLSPYRDSRPRPVKGQVERTSRSKLVGYTSSTSRFMILVVLGLVSFTCAAPLQPEPAPTPTTTPSLVASTLYSSSSSSSSSSSTAIAPAPSFVPRNPVGSESSKSAARQSFKVQFSDRTSNDNEFIQEPIRQLLELANIKVSRFIGAPKDDEQYIDFELPRSNSLREIQYHGYIWNTHTEHEYGRAAANKPGYQYDKSGLCGNLQVLRMVNHVLEITKVFEVENNKVILNKL
ncbi:hypothetical protein DFH05DRAFT_1554296 [Lentinula detonsa]|uniref:Uncharacterized protein n=1 Tax=Lentinula detonsa TaxID=2804962 RepID=A0A9W8U3N4_9AGAR|nr:hypothetical protein DFH05DRAFT_1554296 [Lentinula detonsa]